MEGKQARTGQIQATPNPKPSLTCSIVRFPKGPIVAPRMRRDHRVQHHLAQSGLAGRGHDAPVLPDVGDIGQAGRLLLADQAPSLCLADHLPDGRELNVYSRRGKSQSAWPDWNEARPPRTSGGIK
jgi:hypothetical protein